MNRIRVAVRCTVFLLILANGAAIAAAEDDPGRTVSQLVSAASPDKESKQQFFQRFTSTFRRLAATELMAQTLVGDAWRSMTADQQAEFAQLYEKLVMSTLHGAYDAAAPTRFTIAEADLYRSKTGPMKRRCDLLQKSDCIFYSAKATANDMVIEYRLIETGKGWQLVDILLNEVSAHAAYETQVRELLKLGAPHALDRLRARVAQY